MITFMMGITIAIGVITVFSQYRENITETAETEQTITAANKIESAIFKLKLADSGHKQINLPENLGGKDYTVSLSDNINIYTLTSNYSKKIDSDKDLEGSARGGEVKLYKTQDKYTLRPE